MTRVPGAAGAPCVSFRRSNYDGGMESEWHERAGPWARCVLPDSQELDVVVTARTRAPDGRWWYECEAILPARHDTCGGSRAAAQPTAFTAPAETLTPIPGEDYTALPTEGAVAGRQWLLQRLRQHHDHLPSHRLHRRDCWQADPSATPVTTATAHRLARDPHTEPCEVCRPDRPLLGQLP